ncbi:hypothetical protein EJF36_10505 [Bacillus sp. HMF5848]|uniref:hypothetical protein n=1 Tax=Bacillus sp. HMF5848 TaxID=2495421 RepID=UPI000F77749A|nr:hypothetical protein [Bacillus sp. HMF5848]RSK27277.1 hypothetical protein EJF36_10505 [Bacillus sp. HMF5848]
MNLEAKISNKKQWVNQSMEASQRNLWHWIDSDVYDYYMEMVLKRMGQAVFFIAVPYMLYVMVQFLLL